MHRVDPNDLAHALRLGLDPVAWAPCPRSEDGAINPQVTRFALVDGRWADVTHVKLVYYETPEGSWRPLSEVCSHHGNRQIAIRPDRVSWVHPRYLLWLMKRQRLLGNELTFWAPGYAGVQPRHLLWADTLTAYPDPTNAGPTTTDGYVESNYSTWDLTHDATDGQGSFGFGSGLNSQGTQLRAQTGPVQAFGYFHASRSFVLFATSALTSGATITAATLSLWPTIKDNGDNDGDDWINVVQSSPSSNTAIVNGDFDQCGAINNPTEGATRIDVSGISTGAYTDWTLDATGQGWISKTGVTKLGFREGHDCIDSVPVGGTGVLSGIYTSSADNTGTSQDPKLVVTYTPPPPGGGLTDPLRAFQHMITR